MVDPVVDWSVAEGSTGPDARNPNQFVVDLPSHVAVIVAIP